MREKLLFSIETPYRPSLPVKGWLFGTAGAKSLAVMGALRGNELQQMYICSQLIQKLKVLEEKGCFSQDCGVLVIPCANQFSMNVGRRFWASDNTDINRMFPGYDKGETTQRIAARIFQVLQGYRYGVQLSSFYLPGDLIPHVRMMETGYQRTEEAMDFGLPYVVLRTPQPYDTTTLNYNWQIWDTQAFSLYSRETDFVDFDSARQAVDAVLHFLYRKALLRVDAGGYLLRLPGAPAGPGKADAQRPLLRRRPSAAPARSRRPGGAGDHSGGDCGPLHRGQPGGAAGRLLRADFLCPPEPAGQRP